MEYADDETIILKSCNVRGILHRLPDVLIDVIQSYAHTKVDVVKLNCYTQNHVRRNYTRRNIDYYGGSYRMYKSAYGAHNSYVIDVAMCLSINGYLIAHETRRERRALSI